MPDDAPASQSIPPLGAADSKLTEVDVKDAHTKGCEKKGGILKIRNANVATNPRKSMHAPVLAVGFSPALGFPMFSYPSDRIRLIYPIMAD